MTSTGGEGGSDATDRHAGDLVTFREVERDTSSVLHGLTDQRVATRKQQRLLDTRRVVADHVHHQLHVLGVFYLPVHKYTQLNVNARALSTVCNFVTTHSPLRTTKISQNNKKEQKLVINTSA